MKLVIHQSELSGPYHSFLRSAGYSYIEDKRSGQASFVRPLGAGRYPRFHMYVDEYEGNKLAFKIHLDQKQASYEGVTAHSGEYNDGPVLEEVERLKSLLKSTPKITQKANEPLNPWDALKK